MSLSFIKIPISSIHWPTLTEVISSMTSLFIWKRWKTSPFGLKQPACVLNKWITSFNHFKQVILSVKSFSFQSVFVEYWLTLHIGCYFDSLNQIYVMFTLPYIFDLRFMIMNDIIYTRFNHTDDQLKDLIPMLFRRMPGAVVFVGENERLSESFFNMLKQGSYRGKCHYFISIWQWCRT